MARSRNIKPAFFTNDNLAECQPLARLLFIGLWTIADREGRLEDRPKKIKAEILPYDSCDCDSLLSELNSHEFIIRYQVNDKSYIQIVKFSKHQQPHYKEVESVIPPPPNWKDSGKTPGGVSELLRKSLIESDGECAHCGSEDKLTIDHIIPRSKGGSHDESNLQVLCGKCNSRKNNKIIDSQFNDESMIGQSSSDVELNKTPNDTLIPDSLIPLIDSPIPDSPLPPKARETAPECFDQFWELYPRQRRGSKDKALLAYKAAMKRGNTETTIIEGVKTYAASSDVAGGYAKGCAAWLNDDGFNNQYKPVGAQGSRPTGGNRGFDALATAAAKISQGVDREAERLRRENPVLYYQRLANQSGGGNDIAGSLEAPDAGKPDAAPLGIGYSQEG